MRKFLTGGHEREEQKEKEEEEEEEKKQENEMEMEEEEMTVEPGVCWQWVLSWFGFGLTGPGS